VRDYTDIDCHLPNRAPPSLGFSGRAIYYVVHRGALTGEAGSIPGG